MIQRRHFLIGFGATLAAPHAFAAQRGPLVLAAASLQESLNAAADAWARLGHARPVLSFAASSALARQIAAGAAADLFISADEPWMDDVERRGLIVAGSRANLVGNRLVVVQPASAAAVAANVPLGRLLARGRVALADPGSVPAGRYAQALLTRLGVWDGVAPRVVRGENVRAALALVERGAAEWGVVYATDARASRQVRAVRMLPANSHPPIRYPLARLRASTSAEAEGFRRFLLSGAGKAIFARFGFTAP